MAEKQGWGQHTTRNNNPDEVHEEIIHPKVVCFWAAVRDVFIIVIKHACCIVQDVSIDLPKGNNSLQGVPIRGLSRDHPCSNE